jgi:Flp pilus assembly protein protease CpaA
MDFVIGIILTITVLATITDLKYKIVPNYLNYFLIIFGLGVGGITALLTNSFWPIAISLIGAGVFYAIGALLYYTGIWGGGDAKLLTGYGATMASFPAIAVWPFLFSLFINILFCGAIIGVIGSGYLMYKHRKSFAKEMRKTLNKLKKIVVALYILFIFTVMGFLVTKNLLLLISWALIVLFFYFFLSLKAIEKVCMLRHIEPKYMQEGDWVLEPVKANGKVVYAPEKQGISMKDLKKLQNLAAQGKIKTITIKEGIQYVPAFLLALILSLLKIDLMFSIFSILMQ